jgi:protein O-mannosyl-transferase
MTDITTNKKNDLILLAIIAAVAFAVFANSLTGDFVYDDARQIVRNPLIQDNALVGKALTSDVWAFKGDGTYTASNYWRPTFTAFHILNFRLFGLSPFGWHFLNLLLHAGVCALVFLLLRRWNLSPNLSFAIALIFAVHPVHVESVAWISGSPDLLFGAAFLGSLWFADKWATKKNGSFNLIIALVLYALALGAKEVAMLCFPVYFLIFSYRRNSISETEEKPKKKKSKNEQSEQQSKTSVFNATLTFGILAAAYFFIRWAVLGRISQPAEEAAEFYNAVLSAPTVFVFYLKQIIFPITIGANYPLRAVQTIDLFNFILPLVISILAVILFYLLARRSFVQKIGFALFFLPLLPAMNITAFVPEQIVHDRYLYLSLLGYLLMLFPYLAETLKKKMPEKAETGLLFLGVLASLPLAVQTVLNNQYWKSEFALWEHSVKVDPSSSFNFTQYGTALAQTGKYAEALEAFNRSLDNRQTALGLMGRARANIYLNNYEEAVWDLQTVVEMPNEDLNAYTLYQTYETLALALSQNGKNEKAEEILRDARKRLPIYHAALTEKLAVVLYQQNRKTEVLKELEEAKTQARREMLPESKNIFLRLGMLYGEAGQKEKAREALQDYLNVSNGINDTNTLQNRQRASELLRQIN